MARKPKRKFNLRRVGLSSLASIGALAAADATSVAVMNSTTEPLRFMSVNASFVWSGKAEIDDALTFGFAHSDYSSAEVEECLEAGAAINTGDKIAEEQSNRLVRTIGTIAGVSAAAAGSGAAFNNGNPVKVRLNWLMGIGDTLNIFIRNSSGVVYSAGGALTVNGDLWVKDA